MFTNTIMFSKRYRLDQRQLESHNLIPLFLGPPGPNLHFGSPWKKSIFWYTLDKIYISGHPGQNQHFRTPWTKSTVWDSLYKIYIFGHPGQIYILGHPVKNLLFGTPCSKSTFWDNQHKIYNLGHPKQNLDFRTLWTKSRF